MYTVTVWNNCAKDFSQGTKQLFPTHLREAGCFSFVTSTLSGVKTAAMRLLKAQAAEHHFICS